MGRRDWVTGMQGTWKWLQAEHCKKQCHAGLPRACIASLRHLLCVQLLDRMLKCSPFQAVLTCCPSGTAAACDSA